MASKEILDTYSSWDTVRERVVRLRVKSPVTVCVCTSWPPKVVARQRLLHNAVTNPETNKIHLKSRYARRREVTVINITEYPALRSCNLEIAAALSAACSDLIGRQRSGGVSSGVVGACVGASGR